MTRLLLVAALIASIGCSKKTPPPAPTAAGGAAASGAASGGAAPAGEAAASEDAAAAAAQPEEELKAVYADFAGPPAPLAQKLCGALYDLPVARRAACCGGKPGSTLGGECVKIVSAALRSGGVQLDAAGVDRCVLAQEKAHDGCSWVGQYHPPLPAECDGLLSGHRAKDEVCRSSLECANGLRCLGAGPMDKGRCGPPRGDGQPCLTSVDPLAVFARESLDAHHPECSGYCGHRKCEPIAAPGAACSIAPECPPGQHCDGKKCAPGDVAALGASCAGGTCAPGSRCIHGQCAAPKPDGSSCKDDVECLGGCLPSQRCGMRCDLP